MEATVVCRCQAIAKFSGFSASIGHLKKPKTAEIIGCYATKGCFLRIALACSPNTSKTVPIHDGKKSLIKSLIDRDGRLYISLLDGTNLHLSTEKTSKDFQRLGQFVKQAKDGDLKFYQTQGVGTAACKAATSTPRPGRSSQHVMSPHNVTASPEDLSCPYTSVKRRPQVQKDLENDIDENSPASTPTKTKKSYLESAQEKSEQVTNLFSPQSAKKFYGNSSERPRPQARTYGAFSSKKTPSRKPGLLDVNYRRSVLSNVNNSITYSWSGSKSTPSTTPIKDRSAQIQGLGFSNLGNTCYMNAILQSLFGLVTFIRDLMALAARLKQEPNTQLSLAFQLARLQHAKRKSLSDDRQKACLTSIKNAISKTARRFSGNEQHDAHELLSQVIDQIKEDVTKENKSFFKKKALESNISNTKPDLENLELASEAPQTDIRDVTKDEFINPALLNFEFEVLHTIACLKCGEEVKKTETFNDLSLDMPKRVNADVTSTIQDALDQFFQSEEIEYTCEACSHKQVRVSHQFYRLPRVLVLHLKRYHFNSIFTSSRKVARDIHIPRYLTLSEHSSEHTYPPYFIDIGHRHGDFHDDSLLTVEEASCINASPVKPTGASTESKKFRFNTYRELFQDHNVDANSQRSSKKPLTERTSNESPHLRQALLSNKKHSPHDNEHNSTFSEMDLAQYTANLTEEDQLKRALEMSLQETTSQDEADNSSDRSFHTYNHDQSSVPNVSTRISGGDLQNHAKHENEACLQATKTPSKNYSIEPMDYSSRAHKRRSKSRIMSSDEELPDLDMKRVRLDSLAPSTKNTPREENATDVDNSKPSDMLTALEQSDRDLTPQKETRIVRKPRLSGTSKKLDDIFSKYEPKRQEKESPENGIESVDDLGTADLSYLNNEVAYGKRPTNQSNGNIDQSQEALHIEKCRECISNDVEEGHCTKCSANGMDLFHETNSQSYSRVKSVLCAKVTAQKRPPCDPNDISTDTLSKYFNDQLDKNVQKRQDFGLDEIEARSGTASQTCDGPDGSRVSKSAKISPLLGLPRHVFDPSMTPRLSDSGFGDEDENANVKLTPDKSASNQETADPGWISERREQIEREEKEGEKKDETDPEWLSARQREDEELKLALENSIMDQGNYDDDMKKAIELSLKDLNEEEALPWEQIAQEEESFLKEEYNKTSEKRENLKRNLETGEMEFSYRLMSVVSHLGSSSAGHYISDVYNTEKDVWYSYDDSHVTKMSEDCVRESRTRSGYIFFYVNKDILKDVEDKQRISPGSKENKQVAVITPTKPSNRALQPLGLSNRDSAANQMPQRPVSR